MKSKKSSPKKKSFSSYDHLTATRSIIYLLIIMLAASLFFLFKTYQENIMVNHMFYPFMVLTVVAMGLLVSLLFLVNPTKSKRK